MRRGKRGLARTTAALSVVIVILAAGLAIVSVRPGPSTSTVTSVSATTLTSTEFVTTTGVSSATASYVQAFTTIVTVTPSTSQSTLCVDSGPPGALFLRVLNDSNMEPVPGANVTAVNTPYFCNRQALDDNVTVTFTTGPTEWYSINGEGPDSSFSLSVLYDGRTYSFVADMHPEAATCATLLVPSGVTSVVSAGTFNQTCS